MELLFFGIFWQKHSYCFIIWIYSKNVAFLSDITEVDIDVADSIYSI